MAEANVVVTNKSGLHARPAAQFVETARKFTSSITIVKGMAKANGKSITCIMGLGIGSGTEIAIVAQGEDEHKAVQELKELVGTLKD
ncbi:HPr family phosphocarrier protein [Brevibacillus fluminis]|uniref:Phosphocarrier protein HPr n=1 Tax=Brevibacillus fluminis TaxID=511487 RepID=A0A3M8DQN9_9BACL|nr:HPr family phosphocarrier protein [Brevibacillus fluminis]RNB90392.1 HPr family phosphocarrier protein [Brevibacillus fluminis]